MDFNLYSGIALGVICGITIAVFTTSDTLKKTIIARLFGVISAFITQIILSVLGVPYFFITQMYKKDNWFQEIGHLTVNELIGYNWGITFFWFGLLISFAISSVSIFIFRIIKNHTE